MEGVNGKKQRQNNRRTWQGNGVFAALCVLLGDDGMICDEVAFFPSVFCFAPCAFSKMGMENA